MERPLNRTRIAVVGSGAVGLFYGARMQRAGVEAHFLARSDFEAITRNGISVDAPDGDFRLERVNAHESTDTIGKVDLVIIALKATANDRLVELLAPIVSEGTVLLTLQNGLGNDTLLARAFPNARIMSGLCFVCLNRIAPGHVRSFISGSVTIGNYRQDLDETARWVESLFETSGVECNAYDDLLLAQWKKLVWNIPFNGLAISSGGVTTDILLANPERNRLIRTLMEEIASGAATFGLEIDHAFIDYQIERTYAMNDYSPSSLLDYKAGNPVEVEAIWGEPVRQVIEAGGRMPEVERLYNKLRELCVVAD